MAFDQNGALLIACFEARRVRRVGPPPGAAGHGDTVGTPPLPRAGRRRSPGSSDGNTERDARGEGRIYTIRYMGTDGDGLQAVAETRVVVPRTGPLPK